MLRIIAGTFRRRLLETPRGTGTTRPLPDRVRTAMFNMLTGHLEGETVCDVFAGSGSFGLEALSRGAVHAVFFERDREAHAVLRRNVEALGVADRATAARIDALGPAAIAACPPGVHVVLFDPPYPAIQEPDSRARVLDQFARFIAKLDDTGYAILRTPWPFTAPDDPPGDPDGAPATRTPIDLAIRGAEGPETHAYGSTALHWYMKQRDGA